MIKISFIIACMFLSSCSLYELRPGEYEIPEPESDFKKKDASDIFKIREDRHTE